MKDRIKYLRKDILNLSMEKFASPLKISKVSVSRLESGENNPSDQTIELICRSYNVNEDWLRTGNGDPLIDITEEEEIAEFFGELQSDDPRFAFKKRLITALAHMDDAGWDAIEKLIMEATKKDHD